MTIVTRLLCGALLAGTVVGAAPASGAPAPSAAEATIRRTVDDAFAVLRNKELANKEHRAERIASLRRIADRTFDWSTMARSSLGAPWRSLDAAVRPRFVEVFKDVLAAQYIDDIDRFRGSETVTVDGSTSGGDETVVRTTLVTASRERVPIDYRMHLDDGRWRVVDLSIEGVSMVNHFRKTFATALVKMTVPQLIEQLRRQLPPQLPPGSAR
jgi:phospholipid transport system substrate-binding protein